LQQELVAAIELELDLLKLFELVELKFFAADLVELVVEPVKLFFKVDYFAGL
jgi:hypothetical protein